ncbi:hypothetical protein [Kaistella jeonii]|uniref:Uncharacterized protein n=1 Tax=Kaistella jeonii TaxID=266749 RepID=A0A0C1FJ95_9FLAO|nr:hypothetical protein [Kaistella jeonii]KIA87994.1 hypothetical protein OA86_13205 [Kaistella jeonii]SFC08551.1 hypothetical protein SAMN05421876_10648 [Kaistella jeonii]VEI95176.1 Uncharacterised protein [Kaistella jeonii]
MDDHKEIKGDELSNETRSQHNDPALNDNKSSESAEKFGVQHDEEGHIVKVAENAVPPEAWKNQKKAYNEAWENNKNRDLEDDI